MSLLQASKFNKQGLRIANNKDEVYSYSQNVEHPTFKMTKSTHLMAALLTVKVLSPIVKPLRASQAISVTEGSCKFKTQKE